MANAFLVKVYVGACLSLFKYAFKVYLFLGDIMEQFVLESFSQGRNFYHVLEGFEVLFKSSKEQYIKEFLTMVDFSLKIHLQEGYLGRIFNFLSQ